MKTKRQKEKEGEGERTLNNKLNCLALCHLIRPSALPFFKTTRLLITEYQPLMSLEQPYYANRRLKY